MASLIKHLIRSAIDWVFRRKSPALYVMRTGLTCVGLAFGSGWILGVEFPLDQGVLKFNFDSAGGMPAVVVYSIFGLGVFLILIGLGWEIIRYRSEQRRLSRKRVIVIESRGLRDSIGMPLAEAIPNHIKGIREQVLLDTRQRVQDGVIVAPESALESLMSLPADLARRQSGIDRRDVTLVYGGLAPVPFTFLTGVLIDDESPIVIYDWNRSVEGWRPLDNDDDGKRFSIEGLDGVNKTSEAALAVSISYRVDLEGVREKLGDLPLVHLELEGGSPDCHWSEEKQQMLGAAFLETAISLNNRGVKRLHLFIAAQNSVVFRFGRLYDKRNLPEVIVYQYERGECPPYPWGILMPVGGNAVPSIAYGTWYKDEHRSEIVGLLKKGKTE